MNKFLFSTKSLTEADGTPDTFSLEYYILESQTNSESINISTYGIEIVKTQKSDGIKYTEAKAIQEICTTESVIYDIAKMLSDNTVTPISFEEVINDIVNDKVCKISKSASSA